MTSTGVDIDIVIETKVPKSIETEIESVYGIVEVKPGNGPKYNFESKYGNVYLRKML